MHVPIVGDLTGLKCKQQKSWGTTKKQEESTIRQVEAMGSIRRPGVSRRKCPSFGVYSEPQCLTNVVPLLDLEQAQVLELEKLRWEKPFEDREKAPNEEASMPRVR